LHNFIIKSDGLNVQDEDYLDDEEVDAEIQLNNVVHEEIIEAVEKRRRIVERF